MQHAAKIYGFESHLEYIGNYVVFFKPLAASLFLMKDHAQLSNLQYGNRRVICEHVKYKNTKLLKTKMDKYRIK